MKTDDVTHRMISRLPGRLLAAVVVLLIAVGVGTAVGRVVFADDFVTRADPVRQWLMEAFHRTDPFALQRPAELAKVDGKFAAHPFITLWHVLPGGLFLMFAPLQFATWIRTRHIRVHRWSGRLLLPAVLVSALPGLYFGILIPYGGPGEAVAIAVFGGLLLVAILRGFQAIRRREVDRHREWMIRVFAIAIAISTVRIVAVVLDLALTPVGWRPPDIFELSIWTGWVLTLGAAELWIRYTRAGRTGLVVPESPA
jgi:uncharacterized membrane protein